MTDEPLLKELELFQKLSDREVEAVAGGNFELPLGNCPACLSGVEPFAFEDKYQPVILPLGNCPACLSGVEPFAFEDKYQPVIKW